MPVIDVWAVLADPDVPHEVARRLLARQAAARRGLPIPSCPAGDQPHLARHVVVQCADHDEIIRRADGDGWAHLADSRPCHPRASGTGPVMP